MIDSIHGIIEKKEPTNLFIKLNGFVFNISICIRDYEKLPSVGKKIDVLTYLNVREDLMELYGFIEKERRDLFIDNEETGHESLAKYLQEITKKEKSEININAASIIARASDGSVRDALSILDKSLSLGEKKEIDLNYSFLAKLFANLDDTQKEKIFQVLKNTRTLEKKTG